MGKNHNSQWMEMIENISWSLLKTKQIEFVKSHIMLQTNLIAPSGGYTYLHLFSKMEMLSLCLCVFLFFKLALLQLSGPPVQRDHDAQQFCGGAQPGRDEWAERGGTECGALLQHLGGHVQSGEKPWWRGLGLHVTGGQQEAALQPGRQDGGHRGAVAVEQKHTATQPARSVRFGYEYPSCHLHISLQQSSRIWATMRWFISEYFFLLRLHSCKFNSGVLKNTWSALWIKK